MKKIECLLETKKQTMLSRYPEQKELSLLLFGEISQMLREDFEAISQKNKRLKLVNQCVFFVLEKAREQNVKKQYVIDLLDTFLDAGVTSYMKPILVEHADRFLLSLRVARSELRHSQWSDPTSQHWQRAMSWFQ